MAGNLNCSKCNNYCVYKDVTKSKEFKDTFGGPCDFCKNIICRDCSKLSSSEIRAIMTQSRIIFFFCPDCLVVMKELPKVKSEFVNMKQEIEELKDQVKANVPTPETTRSPSYAEIVSQTENLKSQITILNQKMEKQEAAPRQTDFEPTISEMQERERRSVNILVFGLDESSLTNREEALEQDRGKVANIILKIKNDLQIDTLKCTRIGVPTENKKRPIKLTFPTKQEALQVVRLKSKLNETGVYIKYDQTPNQRDYLRRVIQELEKRKQSGEENLRIKYINSIPTIITSTLQSDRPKNY